MQIRTIPMEQWCALARENVAPPVTICLEGESMRPLIRKGRDPVTIVPVRGELKKGDVVLFTLGDGRYVVHRVWRLREGLARTLGDNCVNPGAMVPEGTGARAGGSVQPERTRVQAGYARGAGVRAGLDGAFPDRKRV